MTQVGRTLEMVGTDIVDEVQKALGNRTDISQARYLRWLNWAMFDLCGFHRKRLFPAKRFHELEGQTLFTLTVLSSTAQAGSSSTTIVLNAGASAIDDYYNDWVVSYDDEEMVITDYVGSTKAATIDGTWDTTPSTADEYTLHRKRVPLSDATGLAANRIWTIMRLETVTEGSKLTQKDWRKVIGGAATQLDQPGVFARYGDSLIFKTAPETSVSFRCYYYRQPTQITAANLAQEVDLSPEWHEMLVLGAIWRGHERLMEPERATEAKRQYVDEAGNRLDDYMIEELFIDRGMKVRS